MHFAHEEGRIRRNYKNQLVYDYFIEDYLGNIRSVITEEKDTATYISSFEQSFDNIETSIFGNQRNVTKELINSTFPYYTPGTTPANDWHSRLNGNDQTRRIGSSVILKVMAGDQFTMAVKGFYRNPGPGQIPGSQTAATIAQNLVSALIGGTSSIVNNGKNNLVEGNGIIVPFSEIEDFVDDTKNDPTNQYDNLPKAYLNYVFFDEQFNVVKTGFKRINQQDVQAVYTLEDAAIKNGYVYVWISNESDINVYFDDLSVQHRTGPIVQENTYYPYGLPIESLSSYAAIKTANKQLYQSKLLDDELDLNLYDFESRFFDPQTARFISVDPAMQFANGYNSMAGNPIMYRDPDGQWALIDDAVAGVVGGLINLGVQLFSGNVGSIGQGFAYFGVGFVSGVSSLYGGPMAAGLVAGLGNTLVATGGNVSFGELMLNGGIGMVSAGVAAPLGGIVSSRIGGVLGSSVAGRALTQVTSSTIVGGTLGAGSSLVMGGNVGQGFLDGAKGGLISGGIAVGASFGVNAILKSQPPPPPSKTEIKTVPVDIPERNYATPPKPTMPADKKSYLHYAKHEKGHQYNNKTKTWTSFIKKEGSGEVRTFKSYRKAAVEFMSSNGRGIASFTSKSGYYFKMNMETGQFGVADPSGRVTTFFTRTTNIHGYWLDQINKYYNK